MNYFTYSTASTSTFTTDISWPSVSADGKYISAAGSMSTEAHESTYWQKDSDGIWFISLLSGANLRPLVNVPSRSISGNGYFSWDPTSPDDYYCAGTGLPGDPDLPTTTLYKVTVSDLSETYEIVVDNLPALAPKGIFGAKKAIAGDGSTILLKGKLANDVISFVPVQLKPTPSVLVANGYPITRPWDNWWGNLVDYNGEYHDQYIAGTGSDMRLFFLPEGPIGTKAILSMTLTGTAADGGPNVEESQDPPYGWGGEFKYINTIRTNNESPGFCEEGYRDPWCCSGEDTCANYFSHYTPDRWGKYIIYSNTGDSGGTNTAIWNNNINDHEIEAFSGVAGSQHHDWHAWSDWSTSSSSPLVYASQMILIQNYKDIGSQVAISSAHIEFIKYNALARPTQSPDGTKVFWHSTFLNPDTGISPDLFYTVAYYPYAPEITSSSANGGTATIRFDWQNTFSDPNPRTYTTRGWPSETTDDRPIPRETKEYRLWRSTDKVDWEPISKIAANHFDRFDFTNGGFKAGQDSFWEISDTPGDGTFYYAITSLEHSGLESRTLSNVFSITIASGSGTGVEDVAYPEDPGGNANITSVYNAKCKRYEDIFVENAETPTAIQQNKIASIPIGSVTEYIDWAGNPNGFDRHSATEVDTQGHTKSLPVTSTYDGGKQYTIRLGVAASSQPSGRGHFSGAHAGGSWQ